MHGNFQFYGQQITVMTREQSWYSISSLFSFQLKTHPTAGNQYCRLCWMQLLKRKLLGIGLAEGQMARSKNVTALSSWSRHCRIYHLSRHVCVSHKLLHCLEGQLYLRSSCAWRMLPSATKTCWSRAMVRSTQTICNQKQESEMQAMSTVKQSGILLRIVWEVAHISGEDRQSCRKDFIHW